MLYRVVQQDKLIGEFQYFHEAWLFIYLDLMSYARIYGPNNENWIVNPIQSN
jgi:hypothetical protein